MHQCVVYHMCMFGRSLFVLLYFFFWPLYCLGFFDLWILIAPLVSSNSSYRKWILTQIHTWSSTPKDVDASGHDNGNPSETRTKIKSWNIVLLLLFCLISDTWNVFVVNDIRTSMILLFFRNFATYQIIPSQ